MTKLVGTFTELILIACLRFLQHVPGSCVLGQHCPVWKNQELCERDALLQCCK